MMPLGGQSLTQGCQVNGLALMYSDEAAVSGFLRGTGAMDVAGGAHDDLTRTRKPLILGSNEKIVDTRCKLRELRW